LAAVAILGEPEAHVLAVQRLALVDAATWWLSKPNGSEEFAYALLAASCAAQVTTEHIRLALTTPSDKPDNEDKVLPHCWSVPYSRDHPLEDIDVCLVGHWHANEVSVTRAPLHQLANCLVRYLNRCMEIRTCYDEAIAWPPIEDLYIDHHSVCAPHPSLTSCDRR
jgi:hypothetical protein